MEPYWSLIRADSVHPVKRAESLVGARAAASAQRKRERERRKERELLSDRSLS